MFKSVSGRRSAFGVRHTNTLLVGVSVAALAGSPATAATYFASNIAELRGNITLANGDGDASSTIIMTNSFSTDNSNPPAATKPITIDTNGFTLSILGNNALAFSGGGAPITLVGNVSGATQAGNVNTGTITVRGGASVVNKGTIQGGTSTGGTGGPGADLGGPQAGGATFANNGTVRGGSGATGGGVGVLVRQSVHSIVNTGLIEGGNGAAAISANAGANSIVLTNSGTIRAGNGQADAIRWSTAASTGTITLELQAGSVIVGNVVGNANVGPNDTFRLGGTDNATFDVSTIGAAAQYQNFDIFQKTGTSTWTLTGTGNVATPTPWDIQQGTLRVNGTTFGSITIAAPGTLAGTGTTGAVTNAGTIAPGNSIGTLTINGNYISNGGALLIETKLGTTGLASDTDLLIITGNSVLGTGVTEVTVVNVGGLGGVTTGEGYRIVQVNGTSANVFRLTRPAIGGAYSYNLFQNDLATGLDGDWYLRSTGLLAPTTPTLENFPVALLGMTELPTLRQRVGERTGAADGIWTRIEGGGAHEVAGSSTTGASFDSNFYLAQIGMEGVLTEDAAGSLVAGINAQYSRHYAEVFSAYGIGSNLTEGMGIGATLTWRGTDGTYLDLQGQLAGFSSDLAAAGYRLVDDNRGTGLAVSLEAGHEIVLDGGWSITPQGQLSYASVDFDTFTDSFGSVVSLKGGQSLKGRVGVGLDYRTEWKDDAGKDGSTTLHGVANLTYEFLDGTTVQVSGTDLNYSGQKFGGELGLGGTIEWDGGAQSLHGNLLASTSFQGSYAVKGTLGFTAKF